VTHSSHSAQELEQLLRRNSTPVIARVEEDALLLDLRTVFEDQDEELFEALRVIANTP
jgi:L-seryl-tRNA(Ser) seleniumtransferase